MSFNIDNENKQEKTIRIANGSGFWGDSDLAPIHLVKDGPIDYLTFDYLAETTMSIMAKQKQKDPSAGYARDFLVVMKEILPDVHAKKIKIISNAGGINPEAARAALLRLADSFGIKDLKVAIILGDNIFPDLPALSQKTKLANMEDSKDFSLIQDKVLSANVYIGAAAIVASLQAGADIIITGRATDTSLTLAPLIYEFGWSWDDYDRLAAGIVAGHILECGAQSTGGNFTDWPLVQNWGRIGYPICEISSDGSFIVTKHEKSDGLVSVPTVSEQLVYEMGHPKFYLTPDVTADFTTIQLADAGINRVRVSGIKGFPPPEKLKVSIAYQEGYKAFTQFTLAGFDLQKKADTAVAAIKDRLKEANVSLEEFYAEYIGFGASYGPIGAANNPIHLYKNIREIVVRIGVKDQNKENIDRFAKEIAPLLTSGPTGITGFAAGRASAQPVVSYWPALIERDLVKEMFDFNGQCSAASDPNSTYLSYAEMEKQLQLGTDPMIGDRPTSWGTDPEKITVPLLLLAYGRSGDKGSASNVGIIARAPELYPFLCQALSPQAVKQYLEGLVKGKVIRYEVPNIYALNFILEDSLGGGGASSLKNDAQGKTHAQVLLSMPIQIPPEMIPESVWKEKFLTEK